MTNRLAQSQSLYLRKHAENPVDWWPWCDEALATARKENKPIFLSIGYSSCHWCTVMEGEAFSDATIAEYLNAQFLPIKVDREERPDIDSIYMQALQMMIGQGGWPLNTFLAPQDLVPFYGGTYFPVQPRYGRPGFLQVCQAIRRFYDSEPEKLEAQKNQLLHYLQRANILNPADLGSELLKRGMQENTAVIVQEGAGTRFPMIPYAGVALEASRFESGMTDTLKACSQRGLDLTMGGIYDHVGGGFHRYTVDATWTAPHFEKMLYDNGQIMEYLANLWSAGVQQPAIQRAIAGTVHWLQREMTAPTGYFYAAQDADSFVTPHDPEPEEGRFYVWTFPELQAILNPEELADFSQVFHLPEAGNFEGAIVLQRQESGALSPGVEISLAKLFAERYGATPDKVLTFPPARNNQEAKTQPWPGRIPPVTDPKMIVAWNSLMISGLARAYTVFGEQSCLDLATAAAHFILNHQWIDGRLHRINYEGKAEVLAQSEDYALFIKALLDLQQASLLGDESSSPSFWLEQALRVQQEFDQLLWNPEAGYYNTAKDASQELLVRERSWIDNATPSANGVAIANLVRLALLSENLDFLDRAEQALKAFGRGMSESPQACPSLFTALDWFRNHTLIRTTAEQIQGMAPQYFPTAMYVVEANLPAGAVGLACQGLTCQEPARSPIQLLEQVRQSHLRAH